MRGITECLKWMLDNPNMELHKSSDLLKRRYSTKDSQFEYFNNVDNQWHLLYRYDGFSDGDWQPYDPNPLILFKDAYMDCKDNCTKYKSNDGRHEMFNYNGAVFLNVEGEADKDYKFKDAIYTPCMVDQLWKKVIS